MKTILTTMQPENPIEVSEQEFLDLSRQGLVLAVAAEPEKSDGESEKEEKR